MTCIVTISLANRGDVHEYPYPLADPQQTKVSASEITALNNTTFLIDEHDGAPQPNGQKKIYLADVSKATTSARAHGARDGLSGRRRRSADQRRPDRDFCRRQHRRGGHRQTQGRRHHRRRQVIEFDLVHLLRSLSRMVISSGMTRWKACAPRTAAGPR